MNTDYAQLLRLLSESKFSAACVLAHAIERSTSRDLEAARIALNKAIDGKELDWPKVLRRTTQTDAEWADSIKAWQIECNRRSVQFEILQSRFSSASSDHDRIRTIVDRLNTLIVECETPASEFMPNR